MTSDNEDFIQSIFCPHVAVLCSDKAQGICLKNNLSFCDLLNPFARLSDGKHIQILLYSLHLNGLKKTCLTILYSKFQRCER